MGKSRKAKRTPQPPAPATAGGRFLRPAIIVLAVILVAIGGFWWSKGRHAAVPPAVGPVAAADAPSPPAPAITPGVAFEKLKGRWQRPDGGYVVEIRSVEPDGKMDAAYYNPRPIHVAKAEALQEGERVKVLLELRDVNYPGSTYDLVYEARGDRLAGIYYQAALQQQFEVVFERMQ